MLGKYIVFLLLVSLTVCRGEEIAEVIDNTTESSTNIPVLTTEALTNFTTEKDLTQVSTEESKNVTEASFEQQETSAASIEDSEEGPQPEEIKIGLLKCDSSQICEAIDSSHCKEGLCECLETHVTNLDNTQCLMRASKPTDPCQIDKQCEEIGSSCTNGHCIKVIRTAQMMEAKRSEDDSSAARFSSSVLFASFSLLILLFFSS